MTMSFIWQQLQRWWALAMLIFGLDWLVKQWVDTSLRYGQEIPVLPFFDITLRYNTGAAFSFLADAGGWQRWFFSLIAVVVVIGISWRLVKISSSTRWEALSLTLILCGAIGNLYDRLAYGHVVDYLQFHWQQNWYFPAFNIADTAISLGVIVMLLEGYLNKHFTKKSTEE